MKADEFWCRAFLAAMAGNYVVPTLEDSRVCPETSAAYCGAAADAALALARGRGCIEPDAEGPT